MSSSVTQPDAVAHQERTSKRWLFWTLPIVGIAFIALTWFSETAQRNAIRELPEAERRALYQRTLATLAGPCANGTRPSGLSDFCQQQADIIRQFAECDAACEALAAQHDNLPTR